MRKYVLGMAINRVMDYCGDFAAILRQKHTI